MPRSATQTSAPPASSSSPSRAVARLSREADVALAGIGLSLSQYRLLCLLTDAPLGASRVAERLDLRPPSVTSLLDGLAGRALVVRKPDPTDRRRVVLALTPGGRRLAAKADKVVSTRLHDVAAHAGDKASTTALLHALAAWDDALDRARFVQVADGAQPD